VLQRKTSGSIVCPSCGSLVGVQDDKCYICGRVNPGLWGFAPLLRQLGADLGFIPMVVGVCSVLYALTLITSGSELRIVGGPMSFLVPSPRALQWFGWSGAYPVFVEGSWWTLLSASWLHGDFLHIMFNMYWVRRFGADNVELFGPARTVIIYVVAGAAGFLLSSVAGWELRGVPMPFFLQGARWTLGASASITGLLGALAHYGQKSGSSLIRSEVKQYIIMFAIMGLLPLRVDNYAHLGGFLGGYAVSSLLNPLGRESGDHMLIAVGCLIATALSLVAALLHGVAFLR
jgi:rhomboid protease GluP